MSRSTGLHAVAALLVVLLTGGVAVAQLDPEPANDSEPATQASPMRELLDAIRDDLVELRFEKVLAAIEALLGEPGMTDAERAEALVLRAQAHVAFGDLAAAEVDFAEILSMRPGYVPDASLTPKKAMDRFEKVQARTIGRLRVTVDPPGAMLTVDGRPVLPETDESPLLLAGGAHTIGATLAGFDPIEQSVDVAAGEETELRIQLTPNARTIVITTEPEDVEVTMDGLPVGRTRRREAPAGAGRQPAELVIELVSLEEHFFEFSRECFRAERMTDYLTVDLLDRSPRRYAPVVLAPARSTLALRGGPDAAEVLLDRRRVGFTPLDPVEVCPGTRELVVLYGGQTIWRSEETFLESQPRSLTIEPRPNIVLVGAESWPAALAGFAGAFSDGGRIPIEGGPDLGALSAWQRLEVPESADLALAVVPAARRGTRERWYLYSPILSTVRLLDVAPGESARPVWSRPVFGFRTVDSEIGGAALVTEILDGSAAATAGLTAGCRVVSVGGRAVDASKIVDATLRLAAPTKPIQIEWISPDGEKHENAITAISSPRLDRPGEDAVRAMIDVAWAVVDGFRRPDRSPAALSNLALLLAEYGQHDLAVETWKSVRWGERRGIGTGTTQYYLARELERLGQEEAAISAYRRAAASDATVFDDQGPRVGPAAQARLRGLGVSVEK